MACVKVKGHAPQDKLVESAVGAEKCCRARAALAGAEMFVYLVTPARFSLATLRTCICNYFPFVER